MITIIDVYFKDGSRGITNSVNLVVESLKIDKRSFDTSVLAGDTERANEIADTYNTAIDSLTDVKAKLTNTFDFEIPEKLIKI